MARKNYGYRKYNKGKRRSRSRGGRRRGGYSPKGGLDEDDQKAILLVVGLIVLTISTLIVTYLIWRSDWDYPIKIVLTLCLILLYTLGLHWLAG